MSHFGLETLATEPHRQKINTITSLAKAFGFVDGWHLVVQRCIGLGAAKDVEDEKQPQSGASLVSFDLSQEMWVTGLTQITQILVELFPSAPTCTLFESIMGVEHG